jgi:putative glutamine amidotransferase
MNEPIRIAIPEPTSTNKDYNQRCWKQYAEAVATFGATPVSIPLDASPAEIATLVTSCAGVILPGSPADLQPQKYGQELEPETAQDDPARESADELLLQDAFNLHKPVLGVCYGLQSINVWLGGSLHQHLETTVQHDPEGKEVAVHPVTVLKEARRLLMDKGVDELVVNSSHHQAIDRVGDGLVVAAISPGDGVVEAVEGAEGHGRFLLGVQWHPERSFHSDALSRLIFERFTTAAVRWEEQRKALAGPSGR